MKLKKAFSAILAASLLITAITGGISVSAETKKATRGIDITVGKGEGYDFSTVQAALDSIKDIPTRDYPATISIAGGIYEEIVNIDLPYVSFKNHTSKNPEDVVITYDRATGHRDSAKNFGTEKTATVTVGKNAVGFEAENITFQNSYNLNDSEIPQSQAVAVVTSADKVSFSNCRFIGRQDTLFLKGASKGQDVYGSANSARVYLKDCFIEGTVDFVFGDATAYFDKCRLNMAYNSNGGHFTAANTTLFNTGFVFNNCNLTVDRQYTEEDKEKIDLGRPWQAEEKYENYGSQTVFLGCKLPDILKDEGFSLWSDETVANKVRYAEYNSTDKTGIISLAKRADFVEKLTEEQAKAFSMENVLRGSDSWNPQEKTLNNSRSSVNGITLNNYKLSIPKGESEALISFVLPQEVKTEVKYKSNDTSIAEVDSSGKVTAITQGKTAITAYTENGFKATADVIVLPQRTKAPTISNITIQSNEQINVSDLLTVKYNYELKSDELIDDAVIRWFVVNDYGEVLVKEGDILTASTYAVTSVDANYNIKVSVIPRTTTSYGDVGEIKEFTTINSVVKKENSNKLLLREGFDSFKEEGQYNPKWIASNSAGKSPAFSVVENNRVYSITANCDENSDFSLLEYNYNESEKGFGSASYEIRMRFNPELKGLNAESSYDIYTNYTGKDKSYYKFRIMRGGNTNSLNLYLYKKAAGEEEVLLAEGNIKDKAPQNSGEDNTWFRIKQSNDSDKIKVEFFADNTYSPLATLQVAETNALQNGFIAFEAYGRDKAVLLNSVTVESSNNDNHDAIRVYLAGDSTVKAYGPDNTIGGWGDFLPYYFDETKVQFINKAEGGRSTRSYLNQGRLEEILEEIRPGDYMFIQFGHNDARDDENARIEHKVALGTPGVNGIYPTNQAYEAPTPEGIFEFYKNDEFSYGDTFYPYESGTFKWYIKQYVIKAREKGAVPILVTPVSRVFFDSEGKITPHFGEGDGYVEAVRQSAQELNCSYIDMFQITKELYESYGVTVTQGMQNVKDDGTMDLTHYNKFGSNIVASKLVKALGDQNVDLANYATSSTRFVSKTEDLKTAKLFILGDTTAVGSSSDEYSLKPGGWGNYLSKYFVNLIEIKNLAKDGESARSFVKTENYKEFTDSLNKGDYVLIQFGHFDAGRASDIDIIDKYTDPNGDVVKEGSYKYYLYNYYIKPILDRNAVPILLTPSSKIEFDADGSVKDNYEMYTQAVKELAVEHSLSFIDMSAVTSGLLNELGVSGSKAYKSIYSNNSVCNEFMNEFGAADTAKGLINMLKYTSATLKDYIDDTIFNDETDSNVTRAEFVKAIVDVMDIDNIRVTNTFADVHEGKDYYEEVNKAFSLGIVFADENGNFYPERYLTKQEAAEIIQGASRVGGFGGHSDIAAVEDGYITRKQAGKIVAEMAGIQ